MNGFNSGAFRQALTDAVLEEYGEVPAAPRVSKRGKGNSIARAVRYAVLAAILLVTAIGSVLASTDLTGVCYPAEEVKSIHYTNTDQLVLPKTEVERVYCPKNIPFRFKLADSTVSEGVVDIHWVDEELGETIIFRQFPLKNFSYGAPEDIGSVKQNPGWQKCQINGFDVTIHYREWITEYWWDDGEYCLCLQFRGNIITDEEVYSIFTSIDYDADLSACLENE